MIDLKELIKSAVHFGHKTSVWSPKMEVYIWGQKNKIHLIDVSKTAHQLEKAADFLNSVAADNKSIMWIGTKKSARDIVQRVGESLDLPYVTNRWIGGTLTNYSQVRKSVTKLLHYEDILKKADKLPYTKKELNKLQKAVDRLKENIGGIVNFKWPLGAVVIVDIKKEQAALKEAAVMGVPVVAIVDTNSDPSLVDYVIPANDDAPKSIKILLNYLAESVNLGKEQAKLKGEAKAAAKAAEAEAEADLKAKQDLDEDENEETPKAKKVAPKAKVKKFKDEEEAAERVTKKTVEKKKEKVSEKNPEKNKD